MAYRLIATNEMNRLLDINIDYLLNKLKNKQAAQHLLAGIDTIYSKLEDNPLIYRESQDPYLKALHYHEAKVPEMDYLIIYKIVDANVYLLGIFNTRENYSEKMKVIWEFYWK